ncbi:MAG TPA: TonB-dependent receptor, partial [Thermoanaerobaculia bacterium]|nr:TonB-dependent receptor [Thermoanaerobaculia bacterium]
VMYYFNASRGFRSGGFNAPAVTPQIFGQESAVSFETGVKSTWLQHRLRCNGAVYVNRVEGFQFFQFDIARGGQIIDNIRDVEIRGLELELQARPRGGWELRAALGLNDSEIRNFDGSGRFDGNQTPGNTRAKLTMGAQYAHRLGDLLLATVRADLEHRGRQYWHADNLDVQEPIDLLNLHFGLEAERWGVTAWAKNLLDERYYTEYADAAWTGVLAGGDLGQLGRPRSYGVEVRRRF